MKHSALFRSPSRALVGLLALMSAVTFVACEDSDKPKEKAPPPPPAPTFTGPGFLHGTAGSLCRLEGYLPQYITGYGLVVGLNGTGMANDVPTYLRQRFLVEMRRRGILANKGPMFVSAEQLLASPDVAVVVVEGLIPPGAAKGTPFDLWVTAIDGTQTTNLDGGTLWTTELGVEGANPNINYTTPLAKARGPMFLNPFDDSVGKDEKLRFQRQAAVLSGGVSLYARSLDLILNQPSWTRSALIANRINDRFRKGQRDREDTAIAKSDSQVRINIPGRFSDDPDRFLDLIGHLFLNASPDFVGEYAPELAKVASDEPKWARDVAVTWEGMGRNVLPTIRSYYRDAKLPLRLAALQAGARLEDELATIALEDLGKHEDPAVRKEVARLLVHLPRSLRGAAVLRNLLDDADRSVRISAYGSLADIGDPLVMDGRVIVTEDLAEPTESGPIIVGSRDRLDTVDPRPQTKRLLKYIVDVVPSEKPLIYITTTNLPRIVVFNPNLGFKKSSLAKLWDNRLMVRVGAEDQPITVFHQGRGQLDGERVEIPPAVANLVLLLGRTPDPDNNAKGFGLQFGRVVNAINTLVKTGFIDAPLEFEPSPLAAAIAKARDEEKQRQPRPDSSRSDTTTAPANAPSNAPAGGAGAPLSPDQEKRKPAVDFGPDGAPIIDGAPVDLNPRVIERNRADQ